MMLHSRRLFLLLAFCLTVLGLSQIAAQDASSSLTPSPTETVIPTLSPTETATELSSETPLPSETPTALPSEIPTLLTSTTSETATETATETPTLSETAAGQSETTFTSSPTSEESDTPTLTESASPTASVTAAPSATEGSTSTSTATASATLPTFEPELPLTLLFTDTFDTGSLILWNIKTGWSLTAHDNGQALQAVNSDEPVTFVHNTLNNAALQVRFAMNSGMFRLSLRQSEAGAYTVILALNGQLGLYRGQQVIGTAAVEPTTPGTWRTLRLSAVNNILRVSVDNIEVITLQDTAPLQPGTLSFAGIANANTSLSVDDVSLWLPSSELPATATATPTPTSATPESTAAPEATELVAAPAQRNALPNEQLLESTGTVQFIRVDTTTQGNWQDHYGTGGYDIAGYASSIPSYASMSFSSNTLLCQSSCWQDPTSDVRALKKVSSSDRVASTWYAGDFSIDINMPEERQVALYFLDWDAENTRVNTVTITDANGQELDRKTMEWFKGGKYLIWNIEGHVIIHITQAGTYNAVVSGVFIDPPASLSTGNSAVFIREDSTTQGNWQGIYGTEGHKIVNDSENYPNNVSIVPIDTTAYNWPLPPSTPRALQKADSTGRIEATWYNQDSFSIDINLTDGLMHQVALYFLDWETTNERDSMISINNGVAPYNVLTNDYEIKQFTNGKYVLYNIQGHVVITVAKLGTATWNLNAVVSAIFIDSEGSSPTLTPTLTPTFTPIPTATATPSPPTLANYGVITTGTWTQQELDALLSGVTRVGQAFELQFGSITPEDAFKRVMYSSSTSQIEFARSSTTGSYCLTDNNVAPPLQARITCYGVMTFTEYTAVHEIGHVYVGRTGGHGAGSTYFGLIDQPPLTTLGTPNPVLFDSNNQVVMGNRTDLNSGQPDWVRGQRGWGSPASTPPADPCDFQQDAFTVNDWEVTATPGATQQVSERDEAAADMFLNWVYTKIGLGGFSNANEIGINNCSAPLPTDTGNPGDARFNFMNNVVLPTLATYVPTPTP